MKVRVTLDADARLRFVVAKYFGSKGRATRKQVREFVRGAVASAVREHQEALRPRSRAAAERLATAEGQPKVVEECLRVSEKQLSLLAGEGEVG
jgi:hypothetical protein